MRLRSGIALRNTGHLGKLCDNDIRKLRERIERDNEIARSPEIYRIDDREYKSNQCGFQRVGK